MTSKQFIRISAISLGLLDAGSVLAQERLAQTRQEKQQARQQAGQKGEVDADAFRNRVQMRMRSMSQEERALMNDLSVNGQQRLEAENAAQNAQVRGMEGSRFGRGYEARQIQENPAASGSSSMNGAGAGPGMGGRGSGGSGGGGRGR
ncbi:MAG: hypothetical protein WC029_07150 [Sulfuricella sp.]|jgi:hypothetical protein